MTNGKLKLRITMDELAELPGDYTSSKMFKRHVGKVAEKYGFVLGDKADEIIEQIAALDYCCLTKLRACGCPCPDMLHGITKNGRCDCGLFVNPKHK